MKLAEVKLKREKLTQIDWRELRNCKTLQTV